MKPRSWIAILAGVAGAVLAFLAVREVRRR